VERLFAKPTSFNQVLKVVFALKATLVNLFGLKVVQSNELHLPLAQVDEF